MTGANVFRCRSFDSECQGCRDVGRSDRGVVEGILLKEQALDLFVKSAYLPHRLNIEQLLLIYPPRFFKQLQTSMSVTKRKTGDSAIEVYIRASRA